MRRFIPVIVVLLALWWLSSAFVQVDESEFVIITQFGRPLHTELNAGLTYKWPDPIQSAVRFDNRLQVLETPDAKWSSEEFLTKDKKNVIVGTYAVWRIRRDEKSLAVFLGTVRDVERAQVRLADLVVSELGAMLGQHDFSDLVKVTTQGEQSKWPELVQTVNRRCADKALTAYGIELVDFQLQRLSFPVQNRGSVFERMRAERVRIATKFRSEGEQDAIQIRADAKRQETEILAGADEEVKKIKGQAEADATRIYGEAYSQAPEFYQFLRTLESYAKSFNENTVMILPSDSKYLQLLAGPAATQPAGPGTAPEEYTNHAAP